MGYKINKSFLLLYALLLTACGNPDFDKLEGPDVFYQICPGESEIIRFRHTIDHGAPSIQLFDKKGNQLEEFTIAPMDGFLTTKMKNTSIQVTYFVGQSDLDMFLAWFKTNKYNPNRIGQYSIKYNYEIHNTYLENKGLEIDSLAIDKKKQSTSLFLKGDMLRSVPIYLLIVNPSELQAYDPITKAYTRFTFVNKGLAKEYFSQVLDMYNTSED